MASEIKKIAVLTSGGDSPGMNAAIRSVVRTCAYMELECVAIYRGYQGMIEGDFKEMDGRSVNNIINKGGTVLKSARCEEFRTKEGRQKAQREPQLKLCGRGRQSVKASPHEYPQYSHCLKKAKHRA